MPARTLKKLAGEIQTAANQLALVRERLLVDRIRQGIMFRKSAAERIEHYEAKEQQLIKVITELRKELGEALDAVAKDTDGRSGKNGERQ